MKNIYLINNVDLVGCEVLHYRVLGLNESSTEDDLNNPIINWLFDITLKKKHPQGSADFRMIKKAKEGLEDIFVGKQLFTTFGKTDLINDNWRTTYSRQTTNIQWWSSNLEQRTPGP